MVATAGGITWRLPYLQLVQCMHCPEPRRQVHAAVGGSWAAGNRVDWQQLHAGGGKGARAALLGAGAGASTAMHVQVDTRLGVEAAMELDFGDHL